MKKLSTTLTTVSLCLSGVIATAQPSPRVFTDRTDFLNGTGATDCTGTLPQLGLIPGGAGARLHLGCATFSITSPAFNLFSDEFTPLLPGFELGISDVENLNADFDSPVFAAGFDFVDRTTGDPDCPGFDSIFTVTLLNGSTTVGSFTFNAPNNIASFIGVQSSTPFSRLQIRETTGGCENDFFGQFYVTPVPEPSTWSLLLLGGAALRFAFRKKQL